MDWDKKSKSDRKWNRIGKKIFGAKARYQRFKERITPRFIKKFQKYLDKKFDRLYRAISKFMQKHVVLLSVKQWVLIQVVFYAYHFVLRILIRALLTNPENIYDTFGEHPLATEILILDIIPIILLLFLAFSINDDDGDDDDTPDELGDGSRIVVPDIEVK